MSSTAKQIMDKAAALSGKPQVNTESKGHGEHGKGRDKRRPGSWAQVKDGEFIDDDSGMGVVVSERIRGRSEYSFKLVHFDDRGGNTFVTVPCKGAKHPVEDIAFSLVKRACEFIEQKRKEDDARKPKAKDDRKQSGGPRQKKERKPTGLSELAKADADKKGEQFTGKTAKKKDKGKSK